MPNKAGGSPLRQGIAVVREILLTPRVLAIYLFVVLLSVAPLLAWTIYVESVGTPINHAVLSFFLGAVVATAVLLFLVMIAILAGGVNWLTGALAERSTGGLLKRLGSDWQTFHNLVIPPQGRTGWLADIDHIAIGPYGVLVIDTKYTSRPFEFDSPENYKYLSGNLDQVEKNARRVRELLHDASLSPGVVPVLVYWGVRIVEGDSPIMRVNDVRVVSGYDFKRWKPLLSERRMPVEAQRAVAEKLRAFTNKET